MSDDPRPDPAHRPGAMTGPSGTPVPVDVPPSSTGRRAWALLLAGPVLWFGHFMLVYTVAEAGCTGDGPGLSVFDPPVPVVVTLVATVVFALASAAVAVVAFRAWRAGGAPDAPPPDAPGEVPGATEGHGGGTVAFTALLLAAFSVGAIVLDGLPALVLGPC